MKKMNAYTSAGLLLSAAGLANGHIYQLPDFFTGLLLGLGMCLLLFGIFQGSPAAGRLKAFKRKLLHL